MIEAKGMEMWIQKTNQLFNITTNYMEDIAKLNNSDKFMHSIWYCIYGNSERFEKDK